jgi:Tetratricopeptide repeat/Caspase domain
VTPRDGIPVPRYPQRDGSRAILIGTDLYDHYEPLPAVGNNLDTIRSVLISARRGGFLSEHCHMISNPLVPEELATHIAEVACQATDVLFVYCSGHGIVDGQGQLQLALQRTGPRNLHYTALPIGLLKEAIGNSPALIKVLIVECCYSGLAIAMSDASDLLQQQTAIEGVYTLTSSSKYDISLAPPGEKFTAFGGALVRLLGEPPADYPAGLTLHEMYRLLKQELEGKGYPSPQQSAGNNAGDLILAGLGNGDDGGNEMPLVLIAPSADDAPGAAEEEQGSDLVRLLRHAESLDTETESLTVAEIDQRLSELLLEAKQMQNDDENDERPTNVLAELGRIVTEMIRIGGNEHELVLAARDVESFRRAKAGRSDEARDMLERVLRVREQNHGSEHPEVLRTRHNLAHIIGVTGDADEATSRLQQLVEDRERILGRDHPDTQLSMDLLAYWSGMSGHPEKAVEIYRGLLSDYGWLYGSTHRRTLDVQEKLAFWAGRAGDAALARDTYDELSMNWASVPDPGDWNGERARKNRDYWSARVQNEEQ